MSLQIFVFGALGAAAPEILRLYNLRQHPGRFSWSAGYILLSLPFYLLGGLLAVVLAEPNAWSAIYIGLSTPIVINTAVKHGLRQSAPVRSFGFFQAL